MRKPDKMTDRTTYLENVSETQEPYVLRLSLRVVS